MFLQIIRRIYGNSPSRKLIIAVDQFINSSSTAATSDNQRLKSSKTYVWVSAHRVNDRIKAVVSRRFDHQVQTPIFIENWNAHRDTYKVFQHRQQNKAGFCRKALSSLCLTWSNRFMPLVVPFFLSLPSRFCIYWRQQANRFAISIPAIGVLFNWKTTILNDYDVIYNLVLQKWCQNGGFIVITKFTTTDHRLCLPSSVICRTLTKDQNATNAFSIDLVTTIVRNTSPIISEPISITGALISVQCTLTKSTSGKYSVYSIMKAVRIAPTGITYDTYQPILSSFKRNVPLEL